MDLNNKNILITGGARGLGLAMAKWFAERGANLGLIDLESPELSQAVEICRAKGVKAFAYVANVAEEEQVVNAVKKATSELGPLNGLVNNAGILRDGLLLKVKDGKIEKLPLEKWQSVINVNLTGVFLCGREVAASMVESGSQGVIVNIASIAREGNYGQSNYSSAKAGVSAMTVTWSKELAKYGIRCAAVAPGVIETEMTGGMKPEAKARICSGIPVGRMGTPEEIAATVGFIFENDYYNGRTLELDGGLKL
ncbi:SDR family oxidoreductase [Endozoicomonas ascidiicola]|uniref:SDR family oxidoreductase n=1 Tax=Endozoicomonas ascidiicola TaxID=1698521 RepID=UPI00082E8DAD|nr:SDR family oxidoreductase [Endozoicomonas ascidiicola]